jgi:lipopolysaccharide export system protein LptA
MKKESAFYLLLFILLSSVVNAQQSVADSSTKEPVYIQHANNFYFKKIDSATELKILSGKVILKQGTALFYCDSCIVNSTAHIFEAFGNVHINDHDTTNIYSDYLRYLTNTKIAYFNGNVKMTDGHATLTTPDLTYDINTKIGTYTNGGRVVNKKSVLTSREGTYYSDLRDIYFKTNVELKDPAYYLKTDSLLYNTETQVARFIADTYMKDSSGAIVRTRDGYYDLAHKHAEFYSRTSIQNGAQTIVADQMASDDSTGIVQMEGNAVLRDTARGQTVIAGRIFHNKKTDASLATKKPLMIIKQDNDSIYVTADTLFTARLTDLYRNDPAKLRTFRFYKPDTTPNISIRKVVDKDIPHKDSSSKIIAGKDSTYKDSTSKDSSYQINTTKDSTLKDSSYQINTIKDSTYKDSTNKLSIGKDTAHKATINKVSTGKDTAYNVSFNSDIANKDSTNRYFEAYRHVRVFSDSVQTVSDSLFYSFVDSTFRLYYDPVAWSKKSQITGDTIYLYTKNKKASRIQAFENSFMVNEVEGGVYNQIKSNRMDGYFKEGSLDSVRAKGIAESIYFIQDEDSAYTGTNQTKSDAIDIYFEKGELFKVVFRSDLKGTLYPITQKKPGEMRLPNFKWLINQRPKTKYDLFE